MGNAPFVRPKRADLGLEKLGHEPTTPDSSTGLIDIITAGEQDSPVDYEEPTFSTMRSKNKRLDLTAPKDEEDHPDIRELSTVDKNKPQFQPQVAQPTTNSSTKLWAAGFVVFALLDCILLGLLIRVSMELVHLYSTSPSPLSPPPSSPLSSSATLEPSPPVLLEDSPFCLPCSEVYLNDIEVLQDRSQVVKQKKEEWNSSLCCAPAHDNLKRLVGDMFIRVHYARDRAQGLVNAASAQDDQSDVTTIHMLLGLDAEQEPEEVNGTHTLPLIRRKRDVSAMEDEDDHKNVSSPSIGLHNGAVKVARTGHYYIHSHVPFSFPHSPRNPLTQYVHRVRNGGEETLLLLENSVFPCDVISRERSCELSFAGGVFLLREGDEIVLRVSNHSCVDREKDVEFGIHHL